MNPKARARLALILGVVLFLGGTIWAVRAIKGKSSAPSGAVAELNAKQKALFNNKDLKGTARREEWKNLDEERKKLTPEQERQLRDLQSDERFKMEADRAARLFALPQDQWKDQIDKDREEFRQRFGSGGPRGGDGSTNRDRGPRSTDPNAPPSTGGRGNWQGPDPAEEDRQDMRRLDKSTPEQRNQIAEYRRMMKAARQSQSGQQPKK